MHSTMHKMNNYLTQNINSAEVGKPCNNPTNQGYQSQFPDEDTEIQGCG